MKFFLLTTILFVSGVLFAQKNNQTEVDLILYNANIITGPFTPQYKVIIIKNGKIIKLLNDDSWKSTFISKKIIDVESKVVLPGFIDAHCHFLGLGKTLEEVDLLGCKSWEEVIKRVIEFSLKNPEMMWIQGRGWDQNDWSNKNFPTKTLLDSFFPDKYVLLKRVDGHAVIANSKLINFAGITSKTLIEGGKILTENNTLTGVFIDNATELIESKIPNADSKIKTKRLLKAQNECLKNGLTQIADAGLPLKDIFLIDSLCKANVLKMRFYLMSNPDKEILENKPFENNNVKWKSVKIYSDGALGSRGALLKKPYCDDKKSNGLSLTSIIKLDSLLKLYNDLGLQVCTHAIGDSAIHLMLKTYSKYLKNTNDKRWRIEHAQIFDPIDLIYFKQFSIIPSVQPTHATSDMDWVYERLCDERMNEAYIYKTLLKNSNYIALGTDFPVEEVSPINTIRAARFRQNKQKMPDGGFKFEEALSSNETFAGMSIWAAKANFWENSTGTLEIGKFADFIVLNKNPYTATFEELNEIKIIETYIGGEKVWVNK
ncbi:MAG: amidohydrolase [Bacteroidetes bacterium]|nr:amidohydrolase [Bacteroidota bacterium]